MIKHPILYEFKHTAKQRALERTVKRFICAPCGRRSGKTAIAKRKGFFAAIAAQSYPDARYFYAAPTRQQAKDIYWKDLKSFFPRELLDGPPREGELEIRLFNGAVIRILGMDAPERIEGPPWNGGVLDEYGNMHPHVWQEHVRPILSDRLGWCWFIGVPEGRNHYFKLYQDALDDPEWAVFKWKTADVLPVYLGEEKAKKELAQARKDMDELTYRQEYEADFVDFAGRAYYAFNRETHTTKLNYNPEKELVICLDFNVSPGVAVFCQEQPYTGMRLDLARNLTAVIGEVWVEKNSNTPRVCHEIRKKFGNHKGRVYVTGDPTGGLRGTAKVYGSDWDIVEAELRPCFGERLRVDYSRAAPRERARVNAMNSRLRTADNKIHLLVDPQKAPKVVEDFEGVTVKDGTGQLEKVKSPMLTHLTDALGYYILKAYPPGGKGAGFTSM